MKILMHAQALRGMRKAANVTDALCISFATICGWPKTFVGRIHSLPAAQNKLHTDELSKILDAD